MITNYVLRLQPLLRRSLSIMTTLPATSTLPSMAAATTAATSPLSSTHQESADNGKVPHVPIPLRGADYRGKVVLAPMVRSGELPSRLLALHYGADLVWGPETVDRSMIGTTQKTNPRTGCLEWSRVSNNKQHTNADQAPRESIIFRIDPKRESEKLIYQIGTASPDLAVQSASLVAPYVKGIDVNAGCPKPFSTGGGMGAALLRTPDRLCDILRALIRDVGTPNEIGISVKIRLLETPEMTSELVNKLCKTGITGLTIHCRTTPMRPRERAIRQQLHMIADICRSHGVACLMNGDVASREEGVRLAEEFGVDGAMIATAAEANSSVFRRQEEGGLAPWREVVHEYMKYALSVENKFGNTKFLLSQLMPGKDASYQRVTMSKSYVQVLKALDLTDPGMVKHAEEIDHILELDAQKVTKRDVKRENKQQNRERHEKKPQRKRGLERVDDAQSRPGSQERSRKQKAEIAAENADFDGVGQGTMAVAA